MAKIDEKPDITIAIPAYNEEKYIEDCIKSIQKQNTNLSIKILVIDNCSTDGTKKISKSLGADVISENQKGLYFARKKALEYTTSEYIAYVDADSRIGDNWVDKIISTFEKNHEVVAISNNFYFYDVYWFIKILFLGYQCIASTFLSIIFHIFNKPDIILGTSFAIRTKELKKVGGFDKDFIFYGEDIALSYRISKVGKIKFLNFLFTRTSARRYKKLGILKTLFIYYGTSIYLVLGIREKAAIFSKRHGG